MLFYIRLIIIGLLFGIPILAGIIAMNIIKEFSFKVASEKFYEGLANKLSNNRLGYFNKERIDKFIKSNGMSEKFTAEKFILLKFFMMAIILIVVATNYSFTLSLPISVVVFFAFDVALIAQNNSQNIDIINSLDELCGSLRIQLKGGVHITDALSECYLLTSNARLKKAFEKVETILFLEHDVEKALLEFKEHFNNKYINTFVVTILQSEQSGKINQSMSDLAESFSDISKVLSNKRERSVTSKIEMLTIAIVIWILGTVGYSVFMMISASSNNIWL